MPEPILSTPPPFRVALPRHSFTPREVARASDLWRACQDVALEASVQGGWTPSRYIAVGGAYLMRQMTVCHERELGPETELWARTWVSENRRDMVSVRQIHLFEGQHATAPVVRATQQWAYVDRKEGLRRAPPELINAFAIIPTDSSAELPTATTERDGPSHEYDFSCWHVWRDAMGHLNHPDYVDVCEEGILRTLASAGLATERLGSRGERILYRASINAGDRVQVTTRLIGVVSDEECLFHHALRVEQKLCAEAWSWRHYPGTDVLATVFS